MIPHALLYWDSQGQEHCQPPPLNLPLSAGSALTSDREAKLDSTFSHPLNVSLWDKERCLPSGLVYKFQGAQENSREESFLVFTQF